jgi:hypothetical protein
MDELGARSLCPCRRGVLVTPTEAEWMIQGCSTDPTGGLLQRETRRGMPVMPAEAGWIIKRNSADLTSRSLQKADPTSVSLLRGRMHARCSCGTLKSKRFTYEKDATTRPYPQSFLSNFPCPASPKSLPSPGNCQRNCCVGTDTIIGFIPSSAFVGQCPAECIW